MSNSDKNQASPSLILNEFSKFYEACELLEKLFLKNRQVFDSAVLFFEENTGKKIPNHFKGRPIYIEPTEEFIARIRPLLNENKGAFHDGVLIATQTKEEDSIPKETYTAKDLDNYYNVKELSEHIKKELPLAKKTKPVDLNQYLVVLGYLKKTKTGFTVTKTGQEFSTIKNVTLDSGYVNKDVLFWHESLISTLKNYIIGLEQGN